MKLVLYYLAVGMLGFALHVYFCGGGGEGD